MTSKSAKIKVAAPGPFRERGKCDDEITLAFDCKKKLYVSRNFLRYASPVFVAMFNADFKEKKENYVKLTGKNFEDFQEFLLCIHPGILKSVTEANVLRMAPIAEEYQVASITEICKECMKALFTSSNGRVQSHSSYNYQAEPLAVCMRVLATAVQLNYDDIVDIGVKNIAKFGHIHYNRSQPVQSQRSFIFGQGSETESKTMERFHQNCIDLFDQLPAEIKCRIFSERLKFWNDHDLK